MSLLAKCSLEPWLALYVIFLFATVSICKRNVLYCNDQIFLEQYETQHESAESTESDARYRKCIIRVPVNRTVRIKFKCSDGKDMHFEAECLQYLNVTVFHNNAWIRDEDGFFAYETGESLCITSKDVMISLDTDQTPFIRHFKALYEVTDTDCIRITGKERPEAKTKIQSYQASALTKSRATYHESQISEKKERFSTRLLLSQSKASFHFKTMSNEGRSMFGTSATNTLSAVTTQLYKIPAKFNATVPSGSRRDFQPVATNKSHYVSQVMTVGVLPSLPTSEYHHILKSTTSLNMLPISSFRDESKIFQRESIRRHKQGLSTASKDMNSSDPRGLTSVNSSIDSLQTSVETIETSRAVKDNSQHRTLNTQLLTSPITELLSSSQSFDSRARSTVQFINSQEISETENLHEVNRGRTANNLILSLKVPLVTAQATPALKSSIRLIKSNGPNTQLNKRAKSAIESKQPCTEESCLPSSEVTNGRTKNKDISMGLGDQLTIRRSYMATTERDSRGVEQLEVNSKIKPTKLRALSQFTYRLGSKGYVLSTKSTASSLDRISSSLQSEYPSSEHTLEIRPESYSSKKEGPTSLVGSSGRSHIVNYSSKTTDGKHFESKTISGSLRTSPLSEREIYNWNSKRYTSSTKIQGSNLRATPNTIGDILSSDHRRPATKPVNIQSINELWYPSASSISAIFLQSREPTEHTMTQRHYQAQHGYKTSFKQTYISPTLTVESWPIKEKATERVLNYNRATTSQRSRTSSNRKSWKHGFVAPSISDDDNVKISSKPLHDRVIWLKKQLYTSLSSTHTPALYSSVKAILGKESNYFSQSLTDNKTEKPPLSPSANIALSTISGFSSDEKQSLQAHSIVINSIAQYESLKDTAISGLHQTAYSGFGHFTSIQSKEDTETLEQPLAKTRTTLAKTRTALAKTRTTLAKTRTTLVSSPNVNKSKGSHIFSTQVRISSKTKEHPTPYHSISVDKAMIDSIHPSISLSDHSQKMHATPIEVTKSVPLSYLADGSLYTPSASISRQQVFSSISEIYAEAAPTIVKPSKSSNTNAKSTTPWKEFEDGCSYHFVKNINDLEADDELKYEVLDIMSLKINRIIAVNWPYDGYLGRAGFIHRGLVVQTMDGRLWYNHMQSKRDQLYIVYIKALENLHRRVRVVYSQDLNDEGTLKEHADSLGVNVGMYFRTCSSKERYH